MIVVAVVVGALLVFGPHGAGGGGGPSADKGAAPEPTVQEAQDATTIAPSPSAPPVTPSPSSTSPFITSPPTTSTTSTTTAPSTTTTTRPVDVAETRWPVTQFLPHDEANWSCSWRAEGPTLVLRVTLSAIVNRADQVAERRAMLAAAKADALAWLAAHGAPVGSYGVLWSPAEAVAL